MNRPHSFSLLLVTALSVFVLLNGLGLLNALDGNQQGLRLTHLLDANSSISSFWVLDGTTALMSNDVLPPSDEIRNSNRAGLLFRGMLNLARQDWINADRVLNRAVQKEPADDLAKFWLAYALLREGKEDRARELWADVRAAQYLVGAGEYFLKLEQMDQALYWYGLGEQVAKLDSDLASQQALGIAYHGRGEILRRQGRISEAIDYFERSLDYLPKRIDYRFILSEMYSQLGRFGDAENQFKASLSIQPDSTIGLCGLGEVYVLQGHLTLAEPVLSRCLQMGNNKDPTDRFWHVRGYHALSTLYDQRNERDKSIEASLDAVRLNGSINGSWTNQLQRNLLNALDSDTARLEWYLEIGDLYYSSGNLAEAKVYYQMAANRWQGNLEIGVRLKQFP